MLTWDEMGTRERLFAALLSLLGGGSIADAVKDALYDPSADLICGMGRHHKVSLEGSASVAEIRGIFPKLFPSDQAVLNAVAVGDEKRCELGCGDAPHPGRPCDTKLPSVSLDETLARIKNGGSL